MLKLLKHFLPQSQEGWALVWLVSLAIVFWIGHAVAVSNQCSG